MENQERSLFTRMQPSRDSIRLQMGRKGFEAGKVTSTTESSKQCQIGERHSTKEHISPTSSGKYMATPRPTMDNLKQWELVECGHNLRVVEKRMLKPLEQISGMDIERISCFPGKKTLPENVAIDANLEEKLKAFKDSKIVQPIMAPQQESTDDAKVPINLELILKQRKGSAIESTDMLQRLEQQVKAIEMDTLATRMRQLEFSSDFEPEIRYADLHRYREHEDLLRNVTDNEAEG